MVVGSYNPRVNLILSDVKRKPFYFVINMAEPLKHAYGQGLSSKLDENDDEDESFSLHSEESMDS